MHILEADGGEPVSVEFEAVTITIEAVSKGEHDSFMAKEIAEQPMVLQNIIDDRLGPKGLKPMVWASI